MNIYKYEIPLEHDDFTLEMPKNSKILSFQIQNNKPFIWAMVNEVVEKEERRFKLFGTGQSFEEDDILAYNFIGTAQMRKISTMDNGYLVLHLFVEQTWDEIYNSF
jgi:hypothetical protein